jgi:hypothetical protein
MVMQHLRNHFWFLFLQSDVFRGVPQVSSFESQKMVADKNKHRLDFTIASPYDTAGRLMSPIDIGSEMPECNMRAQCIQDSGNVSLVKIPPSATSSASSTTLTGQTLSFEATSRHLAARRYSDRKLYNMMLGTMGTWR